MKKLNYRRKVKFIYPIGSISLVLLPAVCIFYLVKQKAFDIPRVIEVNWWNENWNKGPFAQDCFKLINNRKLIDVELTGNDKKDEIKLASTQLAIRKLINTKDSTKCIHFNFNNEAKFWALIKAVNICNIENSKSYVLKDKDLWVLYLPPQPTVKKDTTLFLVECGTSAFRLNSQYVESKEEIKAEDFKNQEHTIMLIKEFWVLELLFFVMIFSVLKNYITQKVSTTTHPL